MSVRLQLYAAFAAVLLVCGFLAGLFYRAAGQAERRHSILDLTNRGVTTLRRLQETADRRRLDVRSQLLNPDSDRPPDTRADSIRMKGLIDDWEQAIREEAAGEGLEPEERDVAAVKNLRTLEARVAADLERVVELQ